MQAAIPSIGLHSATPSLHPVNPSLQSLASNQTSAANTTAAALVVPPVATTQTTAAAAVTGEYHEREPPPYPGFPTKTLYQPGLRQSYSGSEASTDYSLSSCENLAIRQEPQGEETVAVTTSPIPNELEGASQCLYKDMLPRNGLNTGDTIKTSSNAAVIYNKMSPPTTTATSSNNSYDNGNNNNNVVCYPQSAITNNQYQNDVTKVYQKMCDNNNICAPPPYKIMSGSPNTSPTSCLNLKRTASKGASPTPQTQNHATPLIYNTGTSSTPGTPGPIRAHKVAAPSTASAPGTPSATHKSMPLMGCGAIGVTSPNQGGNRLIDISGSNNNSTGTMSSQMPVAVLPSSLAFTEPGASSSCDGSPTQDGTQSLAQLMTALTKQSSQHAIAHNNTGNCKTKRPSTAPATKHLPTIPPPPPPPPPEYPGYNTKPDPSNNNKLPLVWSQPDLTRLAEFQITPPELPASTTATTDLDAVGPAPPCYITSSEAQSFTDATGLSTSSSTSSLMAAYAQQYPQLSTLNNSTTLDLASLDLSTLDPALAAQILSTDGIITGSQSPLLRKLPELGHAAVATRATKMVERLSEENCLLRQELEVCASKVYRLQKLELEIQKVHENYEILEKHSQKQESLEKLMRYKLLTEIKKLRDTNKELKEHLDKALRQLQQKEVYTVVDADTKKELLGKDSLIAKLISQNRELTSSKEQLEAEMITGRSTLQEQRSHISLLENALSTARSSVAKFEEQLQKCSTEEDKVSELQKALTQLQGAVEKREIIEQKLRQKLEEEVQYLRNQQGPGRVTEADEGISSDSESPTSLQSLVRQMADKEQRVLSLEADVAKWKQKYLEERALRQFAVDVASVPKDARIAALEQSSLETEKLIAEARSERLQHLDEVHVANRKCAELENKIKTLQAQLAERDAMIKVLQRHTPHSRNSSLASLLGSPLHSPHPSYSSPLTSPHNSPLSSSTPSATSSRQNSQLDTHYSHRGGDRNSPTDREGGAHLLHVTNATGLGTTASRNNSPSQESQLQELQERLTAQAALFGGFPSGSDQLKKFMWQV